MADAHDPGAHEPDGRDAERAASDRPEVRAELPAGGATLVFHLTRGQRRRYRLGVAGGALIIWFLGLVRLVVVGRLATSSGLVSLVVLAVAIGVVAALIGRITPVLLLDEHQVLGRWGPRRIGVAWTEVTGVSVRERGTARRIVVEHGTGRTVVPVPLAGGSLLSPGGDPGLGHKADLIRQWWQEHRSP